MPQDHLIATCSVKHTAPLTPVQEDGKQGNNKLNTFNAYFLIFYLVVYPYYYYSYHPSQIRFWQSLYWQNSHYTLSYPVTLTLLLLCTSPSLPDKGPDASSDSGQTRKHHLPLLHNWKRARSCHRNWSRQQEQGTKTYRKQGPEKHEQEEHNEFRRQSN